DVTAVEHHLTGHLLARIEVVDAVEDAQQRGLAAARRTDEGRNGLVAQLEVDALQRLEAVRVIEVDVTDLDLDGMWLGVGQSEIGRGNCGNGRWYRGCVRWYSRRVHCHDFHSEARPGAGDPPGNDVEDEDSGGGQQRTAPGEALPVVVGTGGELEDHHRQVGHRLAHVPAEELVVECREQQRGGLAGDAGDGEQHAGQNAGAR